MEKILNIFKALSDENRLRILLMLRQRPLCVCEITEVLNIALSTISAHLKLMKNYGLLINEKDGRWVTYRLDEKNDFLNSILQKIEKKLKNNRIIMRDRELISKLNREICALKMRERHDIKKFG